MQQYFSLEKALEETFASEKDCILDYSVLKQFHSANNFRNFSVKYVIDGTEHYQVNGANFKVTSGQYLLAGCGSKGSATVDNPEFVRGICVDLAPEIIYEVASNSLFASSTAHTSHLAKLFDFDYFPENKYAAKNTHLGNFLMQLQSEIKGNTSKRFHPDKEFYYLLSEKIIADYLPHYKPLQQIKAIKTNTRKELFRKLLSAKYQIDETFLTESSIQKIAADNGFSEYHFYRLFKNCFDISPYQYIIKKRMELAITLLQTENHSISETSLQCGFNDLFAFSKAFKKHFGFPPSKYNINQPSQ